MAKSRWLAVAFGFVVFLVGAALYVQRRHAPLSGATSRKSVSAPGFTLQDLSGRSVSLSDFQGKAVLVDFWATWCPPCQETIPVLKRLHKEYEDRGFQVLGISMDEDANLVTNFVREHEIPYTVLLDGESGVSGKYGVRGIPATFLVDRSGKVAHQWVGFVPSMAGEWEDALKEVLVPATVPR